MQFVTSLHGEAGLKTKTWLVELEGLRGLAALWVFSMHVSLLSGTKIPIVSQGAFGVDLFILLSGFLMVHQFEQRKETQKWSDTKTIGRFWVRRFFRIVPLYYLLLTTALVFDPLLQWSRLSIGGHYPATLTNGLRYSDRSLANVLTHFSFIFGLLPHFAFQTPLPDWSIGLEMQFYLVFPFLMLIAARLGYVWMAAGTLVLDAAAYFVFHNFYGSFPMPSFLPLKMHMFLLGMLIAAAFHKNLRKGIVLLPLIPLFSLVVVEHARKVDVPVDILLAGILFAITQNSSRIEFALIPLKKLLNNWLSQRLGDISYSLYLAHLLFVLPVNALLLRMPWVASLPNWPRYGVVLGANSLVVFPVAIVLYRTVEKPGIAFGKKVLARTIDC